MPSSLVTPRSFFVFNALAMDAPTLSSGAQPTKEWRGKHAGSYGNCPTMPIGVALPWSKKLLSLVYADKE
jgi:hypothetical protein